MKNKTSKTHLAVKKFCALAIALILIITQTACGENQKNNANTGVSKTGFYLDTICTITIFGMYDSSGALFDLSEEELNQKLLLLITDAFKICDRYEKMLSKTIETSDIARINAAGGKSVKVNEETIEVIQKGILYGELSQGAFDITIGKASDLWGFREAEADEETESGMSGQVPDADTLAETMKHVDWSKVKIKDDSVQLEDPEMELDLGGIAKGYIADKVTQFLEDAGVTSAIVDLGGNIVAIGGKAGALVNAESEPIAFKIGIKDPQSESGGLIGTIPAFDKTVVTSGTYERYFVADGKNADRHGCLVSYDYLRERAFGGLRCAVDKLSGARRRKGDGTDSKHCGYRSSIRGYRRKDPLDIRGNRLQKELIAESGRKSTLQMSIKQSACESVNQFAQAESDCSKKLKRWFPGR